MFSFYHTIEESALCAYVPSPLDPRSYLLRHTIPPSRSSRNTELSSLCHAARHTSYLCNTVVTHVSPSRFISPSPSPRVHNVHSLCFVSIAALPWQLIFDKFAKKQNALEEKPYCFQQMTLQKVDSLLSFNKFQSIICITIQLLFKKKVWRKLLCLWGSSDFLNATPKT